MKTIIDITDSDEPIYINQDLHDLNSRRIMFDPGSDEETCEINVNYDISIILRKSQLEDLYNQLADLFDPL